MVGEKAESSFLVHDVKVLATQLVLWDFELFKNIQPAEYVHHVLYKDPAMFPNLDMFIRRFDLVRWHMFDYLRKLNTL